MASVLLPNTVPSAPADGRSGEVVVAGGRQRLDPGIASERGPGLFASLVADLRLRPGSALVGVLKLGGFGTSTAESEQADGRAQHNQERSFPARGKRHIATLRRPGRRLFLQAGRLASTVDVRERDQPNPGCVIAPQTPARLPRRLECPLGEPSTSTERDDLGGLQLSPAGGQWERCFARDEKLRRCDSSELLAREDGRCPARTGDLLLVRREQPLRSIAACRSACSASDIARICAALCCGVSLPERFHMKLVKVRKKRGRPLWPLHLSLRASPNSGSG